MSHRSAKLSLTLALFVACGPSGGGNPTIDAGVDGGGPNDGAPVGSACDDHLDCDSPTTPECLQEIKPLASLAGVDASLADLGLEFPDGYCSSKLNCVDDGDCGEKGTCFRAFANVTAETLRALEMPLMVSAGSLDFLPAYGVCLRACEAASECETGQICEIPLADFIEGVPGSVNTTKFCLPDPACPPEGCAAGPCSPNPCQNEGTCTESGTTFTCDCPDGWDGTNCEIQTTVPDRVIGQVCTSDAQCATPGTSRCMHEMHPLEAVLPPEEFLARVGLDFPNGYCSSEPNCASSIQCGPNGACLAPFRDVTEETFRALEMTFDPMLAPGTLDFLGAYGVCLRSCVDSFGCFADQNCQLVMPEFISKVPGSKNEQAFCVPHPDCEFCNSKADCVVDDAGDGTCVCGPGYTGNGLTCTPTGNGACADSPCENGGTCSDGENNTYTCACPEGYEGTHCQIAAACVPNPCKNGGACTPSGASGFACECDLGWDGPTCEVMVSCPALSSPANGNVAVSSQLEGGVAQYDCASGFVLSGNATRTCQASGQWSGSAPSCVAVGNPCAPSPCQHGGTCAASGGNPVCTCTGTGYTGSTCQTPVDCGALTSPSNGTVSTPSTTFGATATYACNTNYTLQGAATRTCQASATWSGSAPTCQMNTGNPCSPNPCLNSGVCTADGGGFTCDCADGFGGTTCQTPVNCGPLTAPANGTVSAPVTTFGATATYACNSGYTLSGSATRSCQASAAWSGSAPTCQASSCGLYTDVVYRLTGTFEIKGTTFGIGDQTFTGLTNNASVPPFVSNTNTTPFVPTTFTRGFARLRFLNDAAGKPVAGSVRLVEWYMPLEFKQTAGAELFANNDHAVGLIANPGTLSNCGGGDAVCTNHKPTLSRACASNAKGTLAGTALTWASCTPAWTGQNSWSYASSARAASGEGCATGYVQYGNNKTDSILVPAAGKNDAYQVYNQQLSKVTFSGTNYATASWTMAPIQIPNGTGQSNTWLTITAATVLSTDCGTTPSTDLVCDSQ